jgi:hypothetical protein
MSINDIKEKLAILEAAGAKYVPLEAEELRFLLNWIEDLNKRVTRLETDVKQLASESHVSLPRKYKAIW